MEGNVAERKGRFEGKWEGVTKAKGADKRRSRRGQRGVRKMFDKKTGRLIPGCFLFRWNYY